MRQIDFVFKPGLFFCKANATGNDFILFDARSADKFAELWQGQYAGRARAEVVPEICDRHFGIGADGVVFVQDGPLSWDFYNRDGSPAAMCGNAARCFALFAQQLQIPPTLPGGWTFRTLSGEVQVATLGPAINSNKKSTAQMPRGFAVKVSLPAPRVIRSEWISDATRGCLIDTGVPHLVITTEEELFTERAKLRPLAQRLREELRNDSRLGSAGANVTFVRLMGPTLIRAMSFERGVEDFTLSCGTGALAAAFSRRLIETGLRGVVVEVPGGELQVQFNDTIQSGLELIGPAEINFFGQLDGELRA